MVESLYGTKKMFIIYIFSAIFSNILTFLNNIEYISGGSSCAIKGLYGAMFVFYERKRILSNETSTKGINFTISKFSVFKIDKLGFEFTQLLMYNIIIEWLVYKNVTFSTQQFHQQANHQVNHHYIQQKNHLIQVVNLLINLLHHLLQDHLHCFIIKIILLFNSLLKHFQLHF